MGFRQDYLLRMIEQLAEAVRRIAGLRRAGDFAAARKSAEDEWEKLLGLSHDLVNVVDTPTLASMLREPANMRVAAHLLVEEARALASGGDPIHATLRYRTALELVLEARALEPKTEDDEMILELSRVVHGNQLDARYQGDDRG
jgi:hypothetical protein